MHVEPAIAALLKGLNNPSLPGIDLSLDRMWKLLDALGNPHLKMPPVIHIAGTNGKGSTLAFLRAMHEAAGRKVHVYTSPHLVHFNERIVVAGEEICDRQLQALLEQVSAAAHTIPVTFFEATTAAAFLAFSKNSADLVLLETGMGGRLDASNVVPAPVLTIITPIDYDHMEFLGESLEQIAMEKAGIMKAGVPCVVGAQPPQVLPVLARAAYAAKAPLAVCGKSWNAAVTTDGLRVLMDTATLQLPLPTMLGAHQFHNAALAAVAAKECSLLPIDDDAIAKGIQSARWPARLQGLRRGELVDAWGTRGQVVLDGAHNVSAARVLSEWLAGQGQPVTVVCGMMVRKDVKRFLMPLAKHIRHLIAVEICHEDCHPSAYITVVAESLGITRTTAVASLDLVPPVLASEASGTLLICGSLFLAGEVLKKHG